jgi:formylglycine-generating enzyme required for sulfatase activity
MYRRRRAYVHQVVAALICLAAVACNGVQSHRSERDQLERRRAEIRRLTTELDKTGNSSQILRALANEYWAVGELDLADKTFKRALQTEANTDAQAALIALLEQRGRYREARSMMDSLASKDMPAWMVDLRKEFDRLAATSGKEVAEQKRVGTELVNSIGMVLVDVPGGTFVRGVEDADGDVRPAREMRVDPYAMGKYEVTRRQFGQFLREVGYAFVAQPDGAFAEEYDDYPTIGVSWENARAFTIWLSFREGAVYRLPTEAEWEFAARGRQGYRNPWGNEPGRSGVDGNWGRISTADLKSKEPPVTRVGSFPRDRSPFGLFDMAGNAKEWCLDSYDPTYYEWSPAVNPFGPIERSGVKVKRGGSWNDPSTGDFALRRSSAGQNQTYTGNGFRVVREVEGAPR